MLIIKKVLKSKWKEHEYINYVYTIISKKHNITYNFNSNKTFKEIIQWHMQDKNSYLPF